METDRPIHPIMHHDASVAGITDGSVPLCGNYDSFRQQRTGNLRFVTCKPCLYILLGHVRAALARVEDK